MRWRITATKLPSDIQESGSHIKATEIGIQSYFGSRFPLLIYSPFSSFSSIYYPLKQFDPPPPLHKDSHSTSPPRSPALPLFSRRRGCGPVGYAVLAGVLQRAGPPTDASPHGCQDPGHDRCYRIRPTAQSRHGPHVPAPRPRAPSLPEPKVPHNLPRVLWPNPHCRPPLLAIVQHQQQPRAGEESTPKIQLILHMVHVQRVLLLHGLAHCVGREESVDLSQESLDRHGLV